MPYLDETEMLDLNAVFGSESEPLALFNAWWTEAEQVEDYDHTAFALATADASGRPSVRMLLLKGANENGFTFYTNFNSRKSTDLKTNPNAAICFHWKTLRRQIRINGPVSPVSKEEADAYFASRDHGSRVGAWASLQSSPMNSRSELQQRLMELDARYPEGNEVPRPPHWSGWRLQPKEFEFWLEGEKRLHERLHYSHTCDGWKRSILYP